MERSERPATSFTCRPQSISASLSGSIVEKSCSVMWEIHSEIKFTCCSIEGSILVNTDGLPGPVIINILGKPLDVSPRYVCGPSCHFSESKLPPLPTIFIFASAPVIASKPVAKTMASNSYSLAPCRIPFGVIRSIGLLETSTNCTLLRL